MYRNLIVPHSTPAMPPRIPPPSHRHGGPSGPWPFMDMDDEVANNDGSSRIPEQQQSTSISPCRHSKRSFQQICWCKYPQSLYPNWTPRQQTKSGITKIVKRLSESSLHYLDVMQDGIFVNAGVSQVSAGTQDLQWAAIQDGALPGVRARAIFVENLSGPALQMLGTRYNIEPFYFSSSIGWIPSHYQSNVEANRGDHITITLVFKRPIPNPTTEPPGLSVGGIPPDQMIDMQSPLHLHSSNILLLTELLALHIVRSPDSSTIISYHPTAEYRATPAASMHARMRSLGASVYWSRIFKEQTDPTFVVLGLLWYAIYAWDEALEKLYAHICFLEYSVLGQNNVHLTQELHLIRAHLLHYESLLSDFQRTVLFVQDTPFPSLQNSEMYGEEERLQSEHVMNKESGNLLNELRRLQSSRERYEWKVKNVMDLGYSMVNIQDSRRMEQLTIATVKDNTAMKQISYITMIFLPASFSATVFGMNLTIITPGAGNVTLWEYFAISVPLTLLTIWIVVALQINLKQIRVDRTIRRNRTEVEAQLKPSEDTVEKACGSEKAAVIEGHVGGEDELDGEDESVHQVEVGYVHNYYGNRNRPRPGEVVTVLQLDIWTRLCWPFILISIALDESRRKRARMERAG